MPKVDFREEVANVALAELLDQRGLSEGRYVANVVDGKGTSRLKRLPSMSQAHGRKLSEI
jgi:hypothetical protein